jgi:hypothetical protein
VSHAWDMLLSELEHSYDLLFGMWQHGCRYVQSMDTDSINDTVLGCLMEKRGHMLLIGCLLMALLTLLEEKIHQDKEKLK